MGLIGILIFGVDVVGGAENDVLSALLWRSEEEQDHRGEQNVVVELGIVVAEEVGVAESWTADMNVNAFLVELLSKVKVHQLRVVVKVIRTLAFGLLGELPEILKVDRCSLVHLRRYHNDPRIVLLNVVHEQICEEKMSKMVGPSVEFQAVLGRLIRLNCEASVVDEAIEHWILLLDDSAEFSYGIERSQIEFEGNQFAFGGELSDFLDSLVSLLHVSACHDDGCSSRRQRLGRLIAETSIGARDDEQLSPQRVVVSVPS